MLDGNGLHKNIIKRHHFSRTFFVQNNYSLTHLKPGNAVKMTDISYSVKSIT